MDETRAESWRELVTSCQNWLRYRSLRPEIYDSTDARVWRCTLRQQIALGPTNQLLALNSVIVDVIYTPLL